MYNFLDTAIQLQYRRFFFRCQIFSIFFNCRTSTQRRGLLILTAAGCLSCTFIRFTSLYINVTSLLWIGCVNRACCHGRFFWTSTKSKPEWREARMPNRWRKSKERLSRTLWEKHVYKYSRILEFSLINSLKPWQTDRQTDRNKVSPTWRFLFGSVTAL